MFFGGAKELFVGPLPSKMFLRKDVSRTTESAKINELANNLNNDEVENASEVVSDTYFGDNGEVGKSNSRVLNEAENSWTDVSSEKFCMGLNSGRRFHIGDFRRNDLRWVKTMAFLWKVVLKTWRRLLELKEKHSFR
ncbi:hypothetical protein Tco_1283390 [Tanacetum coccineum]